MLVIVMRSPSAVLLLRNPPLLCFDLVSQRDRYCRKVSRNCRFAEPGRSAPLAVRDVMQAISSFINFKKVSVGVVQPVPYFRSTCSLYRNRPRRTSSLKRLNARFTRIFSNALG